jgi:hypothetical protein
MHLSSARRTEQSRCRACRSWRVTIQQFQARTNCLAVRHCQGISRPGCHPAQPPLAVDAPRACRGHTEPLKVMIYYARPCKSRDHGVLAAHNRSCAVVHIYIDNKIVWNLFLGCKMQEKKLVRTFCQSDRCYEESECNRKYLRCMSKIHDVKLATSLDMSYHLVLQASMHGSTICAALGTIAWCMQ